MFEDKALLERYLPNEALGVTQAAAARTLIRVLELAGPARTDVLQTQPSERNETHGNCRN